MSNGPRPAPTPGQHPFAGHPDGMAVLDAVRRLVAALGEAEERTTRSQVSFRRRRGFAYVWRPAQYVRSDVPAVVSVALPRRDDDPRWKEVVHPSARVWMHHLEVRAPPAEVDDQVRAWLADAYDAAG